MEQPGVIINLLMPDEYPSEGQCLGCGKANSVFVASDGTKSLMRWFYVAGPKLPKQHWGIYCEQCIHTASQVGREMKKINKSLGITN